jgi:hypothetical protein
LLAERALLILALAVAVASATELPTVFAPSGTELPMAIAPSDPNIRYVGRFDRSNPLRPRCAWTGSTIMAKFHGTTIGAKLSSTDCDYFHVVVDGKPGGIALSFVGAPPIFVENLEPGEHVIELFKNTEPRWGTTTFDGFQLEAGGKLLPLPKRPERRIEFYGDSITCGYGNLADDPQDPFEAVTECGYLAYGALTARALEAEYSCVAYSGIKVWKDHSLPTMFDQTLCGRNSPKWDFSIWVPQAVVINLCTNDFDGETPDEAGWTKAYAEFIGAIRKKYPDCHVFCALGTMMDGQPLETVRGYLQRMVERLGAAGTANLHLVEMPPQKAENGYGANGHPSAKTHAIMAEQLTHEIRATLNW